MNAPVHAPIHIADDAVSGGGHTSGFFEGHDGVRLRYAIFRPAQAAARGTVVLVQGRNECIEKYLETIRDLTEAGLWVATFDLRGQGLSQRLGKNPRAGHVNRFADYESDLERFLTEIVLPDTRLPFHMIGHSLGGLIALSLGPRLANRIDRLILSAPLVGLSGLPVSPRLAFSLAAAASLTGFGGLTLGKERQDLPFENNPLTSCPVRFEYYAGLRRRQPELGIGQPTARWLREIHKAMRRVHDPEHLTRIAVPTLILAPVRDSIVPYRDMERLARRFRAAQLVPIAGARHELLQEQDFYRAQAMAAIMAFLPEESGLEAAAADPVTD